MDQEALVSALKALRNQLVHKEGPFCLFMLLGTEAGPAPSWNLIVSSPKLDSKSRADAIKEILEKLKEHNNALRHVTRASVLKTSDPFVRAVNSTYRARNQALDLVGVHVSGFDVPRAILVDSQRQAA